MATFSVIAIKGNHLGNSAEIFQVFKCIDNNRQREFDSFNDCVVYLFDNYFDFANRNISLRGFWLDNNWTIICDPELVDSNDEGALIELSKILDTEVMVFMIQTTSSSFSFSLFNRGQKQRLFFASGGEISENFGAPLKEESGLNVNEKVFADDIHVLANRFGVDIEGKELKTKFYIKELDYSEDLKKHLAEVMATHNAKQSEKKWWKFW